MNNMLVTNMLMLLLGDSDVELCSCDDPFHLNEPKALDGCHFAAWSFTFFTFRIYNRLLVEMKTTAFV